MFCSKVRNIKIALISNLKSFFINANYCKELSKLKCGLDKKLCQIILKWMGVSQIQFLHPLKFFSLIKNIFFRQITDNLTRPQFKIFFSKSPGFFRQIETMSSRFFFLHDVGGHFFFTFSCEILKSWDIWRIFLRFPSKMIHFCQWWERAFTEKLKEQCWGFLPKGILASDNINKHGVAFPKFFGKFFDFVPTTSKSDRWSLQAQKILLLLWISRKILEVYWVLKLFVCFD